MLVVFHSTMTESVRRTRRWCERRWFYVRVRNDTLSCFRKYFRNISNSQISIRIWHFHYGKFVRIDFSLHCKKLENAQKNKIDWNWIEKRAKIKWKLFFRHLIKTNQPWRAKMCLNIIIINSFWDFQKHFYGFERTAKMNIGICLHETKFDISSTRLSHTFELIWTIGLGVLAQKHYSLSFLLFRRRERGGRDVERGRGRERESQNSIPNGQNR